MEILTAPWEACKIMTVLDCVATTRADALCLSQVIVASTVCVFAGGWGGKLFYLYTDPEFTWGNSRSDAGLSHSSSTGGAMDKLIFSGQLWQLDWLFW